MAEAARLYVLVDANTTGLTRGLARAQTQLTGFDRKATSTASRLSGGLTKAAKVGGLGLAVGLGYAVKSAATFEKQMSSLGAVTNANSRQMADFRKQAVKAGADTAFSAREAALAQTELAKGGLSVSQILGGGLESALSLAAAGELELGAAASYTANALNLFKMRGSEAGHVADLLAIAANKTTADVSHFGMALTQGGAAAKAAGMSLDETVLSLEALALAGVKGSDAGTSLKAAMTQIAAPTKKSREMMDDLGISFFNSQGKIKSVADMSDMLRGKLAGMSEQQRLATVKTIAGTDGMRALLALYDIAPSKIGELTSAHQKQGVANDIAAKKQDNLTGDVEKFIGSIETLAITEGGTLTPALRSATQAATGFVNEIASGTGAGGQFRDTIESTGQAVGNLGSAIGPTGLSLAKTSMDVLQFGANLASSRAGVVLMTAAIGALAARFLAMRFGATAGGIVAVGRALMSTAGAAAMADVAMSKLSTAMRTNPVGMVLTGVGLLAGAMIGLTGAQGRATVSTNDLKDAQNALYDATKRVRDLDLEASSRKLAHRRSVLTLKQAEQDLTELRKSGRGSALQLKDAELRVDEARQDVQRTTREMTRTEGDAKQAKDAHKRAVEDNRKALEGRMQTLRRAIAEESKLGVNAKVNAGEISRLRAELERTEGQYRATFNLESSGAMRAISLLRQGLASIPRSITTVINKVNAGRGGGHASGHKTTGPEVALIGEGGGPEYVIPTESRYRRNGLSLWQQAGRDLGVPGFAAGTRKGIGRSSLRFPLDKLENEESNARTKFESARSRVQSIKATEKKKGLGAAQSEMNAAKKNWEDAKRVASGGRRYAGMVDKQADLAAIARGDMEAADKRGQQGKFTAAKKRYLEHLKKQRGLLELAQGMARKGGPYWRELEQQIGALTNEILGAKDTTSQKAQDAAEGVLSPKRKKGLDWLNYAWSVAQGTETTDDDLGIAQIAKAFWEQEAGLQKNAPLAVRTGIQDNVNQWADTIAGLEEARKPDATTPDAEDTATAEPAAPAGPTADEIAERERLGLIETIKAKTAAMNAAWGYTGAMSGDLGFGVHIHSVFPPTVEQAKQAASGVVAGLGYQGAVTAPRAQVG